MKQIKNYIIPVIISILFIAISVFATNYITENGITSPNGNFTNLTIDNLNSNLNGQNRFTIKNYTEYSTHNSMLNDTGLFYNGELVSTKTNTKTLCYSSSGKGACDYICSNSSDCSTIFNNAYTGSKNKTLYVRNSFYNVNNFITPLSNLTVYFEDGTIINNTGSTYTIFRHTDLVNHLTNYKQYGGSFYCGIGCWYSNGNLSDITIQDSSFDTKGITAGFPIFFDAFAQNLRINFIHNIVRGTSAGWDMVGGGWFIKSKFNDNYFYDGNAQAFGVTTSYYSEWKNNHFENVGNIVGLESSPNIGNIINDNIAVRSGNIKLSLTVADNSTGNTVDNNKLFYSGGIEVGNGQLETITNNLIFGSLIEGITGTCDHCKINYNTLYNTNINNNVITWNDSSVAKGGINLYNNSIYPSPTNSQIIGNTLYRDGKTTTTDNGTVLSAANSGAITIDKGVLNTYIELNNIDYPISYSKILDVGTNTTIFNNYGYDINTLYGTSWNYKGLFAANNLSGNLSWTNLYGYPVACPAGSYITQLGSAIVCSSINIVQDINMQGYAINNLSTYSLLGGFINNQNIPFSSSIDNSVVINQNIMNNNITSFTITAWIYTDTSAINYAIASKDQSGARSWTLQKATNFIRWEPDGASFCDNDGSNRIPNNQWTFISVVVNNTNVSFYFNGVLDSNKLCNPPINQTSNIYIGRRNYVGVEQNFNGSIDEVLIYNKTLSTNDLLRLYNLKKDINNPNTKIPSNNLPFTDSIYNLGSSVLRWLKLWVVNIDASGTINATGNINTQSNFTVNNTNGFTGSGTSCVISEIKGGIITSAVCT